MNTFNIGDKVRFKADSEHQEYRDQWFPGEFEFTIRDIFHDEGCPSFSLCYFEGHHEWGVFLNRLELVEDEVEPSHTFKVGDRVRRINEDNGYGMEVGTEWVVSGVHGDWLSFENFSGGFPSSNAKYFELVTECPFKAGDLVEALQDCDCFSKGYRKGDRFTLAKVVGQFVEFYDNNDDYRYRHYTEFRKVSLQAEPEFINEPAPVRDTVDEVIDLLLALPANVQVTSITLNFA